MISIFIKSILKTSLGYLGFMTVAVPVEQIATDGDFFLKLLESVPSQVAVVLGVIYLGSLLFRRISDDWTNHKINRIKVKQVQEQLNQEKIETASQQKKLNGK